MSNLLSSRDRRGFGFFAGIQSTPTMSVSHQREVSTVQPSIRVRCEGQGENGGPSYCVIHCQSSPPIGSYHGDHNWDKHGCVIGYRSIEAGGTSEVLRWPKTKCTGLVGRGGVMDALNALSPDRLG